MNITRHDSLELHHIEQSDLYADICITLQCGTTIRVFSTKYSLSKMICSVQISQLLHQINLPSYS